MSLDLEDRETLPDPTPEVPAARLGRTVAGHAEPVEASNGSSRASAPAAGPTSRPSNPSRSRPATR